MFLTICIPTYNRAYTLGRTLDSIEKQTDHDFETILVDDGSNDNTEEIASKYIQSCNLKYIKKANGGKHTALNIGIEYASGDFFVILDSDDWLDETYVEKIKASVNSDEYLNSEVPLCGVMGKCENITNKKIIGDSFEKKYISYIDFHFRDKKHYGDCCECIKTSILKKYRWPEPNNTKFVPEALVFDQIGIEYSLYCLNDVFEYKEYLNDGITNNNVDYIVKNNIGYLYNYISKLENVFPKCKKIPLKKKISIWRMYWHAVRRDKEKLGPRVKKNTFLGVLVYFLSIFI